MALFRKGKIELFLNKYNYTPGDSITGNVNLLMEKKKKPVVARGLSVGIVGKEKVKTTSSDGMVTSTTREFFSFKIPLDEEKEYTGGTYEFDMRIPETILEGTVAPPEPEDGTAMMAAKVARLFATGEGSRKTRTRSRVDWYVVANLDIARSLDVHKEAQITIG